MSEPGPLTAAGGIALYKLAIAGGLAGFLAAVVVMAMTFPRSLREGVVSLISTLMASLGGGAFVVRYFELQHWASDFIGLVALGGVMFVCALPGWVLVRSWFAFAELRKGATLLDLIREIRSAIKG